MFRNIISIKEDCIFHFKIVVCSSTAIYMKFHFWKNRNFTDIIWTTLPGLVVKMIIWKLEDNHQFAYSFDNQTLVCFQPSFEGKIVFCQRREILPSKSGFLIFLQKYISCLIHLALERVPISARPTHFYNLKYNNVFMVLPGSQKIRVIHLFATVNRNMIQA